MKKILATALALILALSLSACGDTSDGDADKTSNPSVNDSSAVDSSDVDSSAVDDATSNSSQDTGYVGTWKVVPPDENFPPLFLVLNDDGTAGWGAKLNDLSPRIWYECEEDDAKEGQMELSREDNRGYGDDFYLTEDGNIYMEVNLKVGDVSYDHIYFERQ